MAPPILRKILGPRGVKRFDPSAPLYVRRRISLGPDANGVPQWLEPGAPFDAASIKPMRLAALFSSRHIAHERPGEAIDVRGRPVAAVPVEPVTEPRRPPPIPSPASAPAGA